MTRLRKLAVIPVAWLACFAVVVMPHSAPGQGKKQQIIDKLQGTWVWVSFHKDGKLMAATNPQRWTFDGLNVTERPGLKKPITQAGKWKIVEAGEKHFKADYDITLGSFKGETCIGIGDFKNGQFRYSCRAASSGGGRPDEFVTKAGDNVTVYIFEKAK